MPDYNDFTNNIACPNTASNAMQNYTQLYEYDGLGNILKMHSQGNWTRKVVIKDNIREERYYIGGYEVYRKYSNSSLDIERKTLNISDDEKVFVRIESTSNDSITRYQYDNHLSSACLELSDDGSIISYEEYHSFGTTSYRSGRSEEIYVIYPVN
ncbi:MAG: hypothetical protein LBP67_05645 [Bacteroidales bacterium]|jgi:hypothetical protein|nr:hypothetical protein [Bacteroidales bacterium]